MFNKTYISFLSSDGSWTEPRKLINPINTNEGKFGTFATFIASDNVTLYFASDRNGGLGNCDIYYSKRLDDTWLNWSEPVNLGRDINTSDWDAYYSISAKGDYLYRESGSCPEDWCGFGTSEYWEAPQFWAKILFIGLLV